MKFAYRPDIDGLRAIAVMVVVLFHLDIELFSGGFLGVDVFFVISGFLITKLILKELSETGQFSFSNFYMRRARRLFPAMFVTLGLTLLAGYFLLTPQHLERLGSSTIHAVLSLSNIFFWSESGYFDLEGGLKPLLHTWSLSVEEQFYLVWPLSLVLLYRAFGASIRLLVVLYLAGIASLIAAEWMLQHDPVAAFFLAPFRLLEFVIGGSLVWMRGSRIRWVAIHDTFFVVGLSLIVGSVLSFSSGTPFPGFSSLVPCLGTAMVILAGERSRLTPLLTSRPVVALGLISYSLYLVHWPLTVYYKYYIAREFNAADQAMLVVVSILIAAVMYRFVETPLRRGSVAGRQLTPGAVGFIATACAIIIIYPAAATWAKDGWDHRISGNIPAKISMNDVRSAASGGVALTWGKIRKLSNKGFEDPDKVNVFVIGDSQAGDLTNALVAAFPEEHVEITTRIVGVYCGAVKVPDSAIDAYLEKNIRFNEGRSHGSKERCMSQWNRAFVESVDTLKDADVVLVASLWYEYHLPYIASTADYLSSISPASVVIVGNKGVGVSSEEIVTRCAIFPGFISDRCKESIDDLNQFAAFFYRSKVGPLNEQLRSRLLASSGHFLDMGDVFCNDDREYCMAFTTSGKPMLYDRVHTSREGISYVANQLQSLSWFREAAPGQATVSTTSR